jgi:hypothetical protein
MAVNLSPFAGVGAQLFDNNGNVLAGGKIYSYLAGTNTPATVYTSSSGVVAHSNPIILDASGRVPGGEIWLTDGISYKFVVQDASANLIATYDNLSGINSNFVAYTSQQEIQTATAGQTLFTLTTIQYQPGTNNLSVFVDGVNQYGPGAQYAYVETSTTSITFENGLHVGALVKFTTASPVASAVVNACNVSYKYPSASSINEAVCDKLNTWVTVKDYGAIGDGTTDDTVAIQNAINENNGNLIYFPNSVGGYKITSTLTLSGHTGTELIFSNGGKITANLPSNNYAIQFLNCQYCKLANAYIYTNQNGINLDVGATNNSTYNQILNSVIVNNGTLSATPPSMASLGLNSIGINFASPGVGYGNYYNLIADSRISNFATGVYMQNFANANKLTQNTVDFYWRGIVIESDENQLVAGYFTNAPGTSLYSTECYHIGNSSISPVAYATFNTINGTVAEPGNYSLMLNIDRSGNNSINVISNCSGFQTGTALSTDLIINGNTYTNGIVVGSGSSNLNSFLDNLPFTPNVYGLTTAGAPTYGVQKGVYSRVGNIVTFFLYVTVTDFGGAAGQLAIGGLPINSFTQANSYQAITIGEMQNVVIGSGNQLTARINGSNSNAIVLYKNPLLGGASSALNVSDCSATFYIVLSGSYLV